MSSDMSVAIRLENAGKKYLIRHNNAPHYQSLRDTLAQTFRRPGRLFTKGHQAGAQSREEFWALRDISLDIRRGERIGVIGRNGAGKSTLLKLISRITAPSEGRILLNGRVGTLLEVGTGFHPELTGRENIFLNGAILGMKKSEIQRKFDEIVSFAEIGKFLDTPVKRYSSGMYVRLAFAVAAHMETETLLVDEVLAVGDQEFQKKCLGKMKDISSNNNRTILFVSHNLGAIIRLCGRAVVLHEGRIVFDGDCQEAVNYYSTHLAGDASSGINEQIADLPPDRALRLERIRVGQNGVEKHDLFNGEAIEIEFQYELREEVRGFHIYFQLCDLEGTVLFESLSDGDYGKMVTFAPGRYTSTAIIPANLLNASRYELRFLAAIHKKRRCFPNYISVPIHIIANGTVNSSYPDYRSPGKLLPRIPWSNLSAT